MSGRGQIGILTFHRCINYGSYWQARCLVEGLRGLGWDAVLMDHRSSDVDRMEWRCALHPVPEAAAGSDRGAYANKTRLVLEAVDNLPLSAPFPIDSPQNAEPFEQVLVGSDEVWNLRHPWYGQRAIFYGRGLSGRLASYAASFGNQDAAAGLSPDWGRQLKAFDAIAVRDENSRQIISRALNLEPEMVLDPCLQFPDLIDAAPVEFERPYIAVYGHSFPPWFIDTVRSWAADQELMLVSVGYRNDWADRQWIDATPQQFAGVMAGSSAVATNFFHGCVFSLVNEKPFVCAPSEYRNNKVRDLLDLLGMGERLLAPTVGPEGAQALLRTTAGTEACRTIDRMRQTSRRYLEHVLN
jgi:hypothetical protein